MAMPTPISPKAKVEIDIIKSFRNDPDYSPFLDDKFDPQSHASHLVQGVVIAEHLNKLSLGINKLDKEIRAHVGSHYEDLLSQTTGIEILEDVINNMHGRIQTLLAGVERLRARIVEPYTQIEQHVLMLDRIQRTCELLRKIIRCLTLSQRLQDQLSRGKFEEQLNRGPKDITKAAVSLSELDDIMKTSDLTGIEILEKEQKLMRHARSDIEKQSSVLMDKGMEMQNQTQVGTALQVFYNLGILAPNVDKVLDDLIMKLHASVVASLDVQVLTQAVVGNVKSGGPGKAAVPTMAQSVQFRTNLWAGLEKLMDDIYAVCLQTSHLHKVLVKKKDPLTHTSFLDEVNKYKDEDLFTYMWKRITKVLTEEFAKVARGSNLIHQALEVDYPKLLRLYGDLWKKLQVISSDISATLPYECSDSAEVPGNFDHKTALRNSLAPFEKAYIARSLSRLFDVVNLMFSTPDVVPSREEIDNLLKTITSELNVSAVDSTLNVTISKNVVKTLQLFCQKCEQLVVMDEEAKQVIGPLTPGQVLNVNVVNQLFYTRSQMERMATASLAHLSQPTSKNLLSVLPMIDGLMEATVDPLFSSVRASMEAIIFTMHKEDFSSNKLVSKDENNCSLYMKELDRFMSRAAIEYISQFHSCPLINRKIQSLSSFTLDQFIRHVTLLRPVGEEGKMRLTADFAQVESVVKRLSNNPSELGRLYRTLRALRPFLFHTPQSIAASPLVGDVIPFSTVLHLLFSRAPPEMKSPHQTANWSVSRFSEWLDEHQSERERLSLIQGALEAYVSAVRAKRLTEFDSLYPIMVELLEKGMAQTEKSSFNH